MAKQRVTIKDIARISGVSVSTVSRAINGNGGLSEDTRKYILEICDREGYRANALARSLIHKKTNIIGVIVPDITNPYFSELAFALEKYAKQKGYNIILCNSMYDYDNIKSLFDFLISLQVDGIILASSSNYSARWVKEYTLELPTVLLGSTNIMMNSKINAVSINNMAGGRMAAEYLLSLGHRKILYAGFRSNNITHQLRFKGFCQPMEEAGLSVDILENYSGHSSMDVGYEAGKKIFSTPLSHTAIFAATDSVALGILKAADEMSLSCPEDFSLMGFDNIIYSSLPKLMITTIDQKKSIQAENAVEMLTDILEAPLKNQGSYTQRLIDPCLVERNSCRAI